MDGDSVDDEVPTGRLLAQYAGVDGDDRGDSGGSSLFKTSSWHMMQSPDAARARLLPEMRGAPARDDEKPTGPKVRWAFRDSTQPLLNLIAGVTMYVNFLCMGIFFACYRQFQVFTFDEYRIGRQTDQETFVSTPLQVLVGPVNICIAIAAFPLVTGNFHFLLRAWGKRILALIRVGPQWLRWVEYSITASTMMVALSALCGVYSVGELIAIFGCYVACMIFGGIAEDALISRGEQRRVLGLAMTVASFLVFFAAWAPPVISFQQSLASATEPVPGFVYVSFYWLLVSNLLFPAVFVAKMVGLWRTDDIPRYLAQNATKYESAYVVLSFASKQGLAWTIFGAAFQIKNPEDIAIADLGYSQWMLMVVLASAVSWVVSAAASYLFNGSLTFLWGHLASNTSPGFRRLYACALCCAAPLYAATMVIGIVALRDTHYGAVAALLLAASVSLQCVYFPCAENALAKQQTPRERTRTRRTLAAVLFLSAACYAAYVGVAAAYATTLWAQAALGAMGGVVALYMFLFDGVAYVAYAVPWRNM